MALALRLAAKGRGSTSPNPMVGAVVVAGNRIVGQGYHRQAGGPHAEVVALQAAGARTTGATLYVTLEPCSHTRKRTPPCVPLVIASGPRRVVVAMQDPNPRVSGQGIRALRKAGIEVTVGCLCEQAEQLNERYCHWVRTGRPFVVLKAAMTLDGKIATSAGESQWITSQAARREGHRLRSEVDAVMVGIGTVLRDDPQLTARLVDRRSNQPSLRQPVRVVLDSTLRIPSTARVLTPVAGAGSEIGTIVATTAKASRLRIRRLRAQGVTVLVLPAQNGQVSLRACLARLGRMGISSVMIEGGSELNASALRAGVVNRVLFYVAPLLLGGQDAKAVIGGRSPKLLAAAIPLMENRIRRIGTDILIEGTPQTRGSARRT
ncbi:MAG: bifunctional diaminohydroxyphosphoribosylaminopyrimidine deaminase/5-amino-6-(5-phosphoribosylamino)uracil reductase RibD [Nitrospirae bacterium]|nr:bifunctional diaminohydroxyphosphoribosylaminopyrimidine deaminase/5-amino-6-(5-phosphoribosylamino)uracil reductase RibD [Nitrospirota bacterium]